MRLGRIRFSLIYRSAIFISALLMLGAVAASPAYAGSALTPWGSTRQVALVGFNGRLYMAWIDPHANNELTIASTTDGVHWSTGTHPLGSGNSNTQPALAVFNGRLWLAWTGTDANSTLNLSSSANGTTFTQAAQPLGRNNSPDGPALRVFNNRLYYAWKGTDSKHTLNIASSPDGSAWTTPEQPGGGTYSSVNAPTLAVWNFQLYLGWTDTSDMIHLASSADGVNFSQFTFQDTRATSLFQPSIWPDTSTGALDVLFNAGGNLGFGFISYTGSPAAPVSDSFTVAPVEAPTIYAFGSIMVDTWLGTDPGHTINMCFSCY